MFSHLLPNEIFARPSNWKFLKVKFSIRPCTACCSVVFSLLTQVVFVLLQASLLGYFPSCKFRYTTTECCALPTSAPLGTASSDPLNALVNAGFRLQQKELELPGKTGLLGVQTGSAWLVHIFNMLLNGSAHKISNYVPGDTSQGHALQLLISGIFCERFAILDHGSLRQKS